MSLYLQEQIRGIGMRKNEIFQWIRQLCAIVWLVTVLSLTGCWSSKEIDDLAVINVMGIDENDTGQVEITAVIVKPTPIFPETASGGAGDNQPNKFLIATAAGKSIFEAMGQLSRAVSERIYFGHVDVIVFGERAARERMVPSLDFFRRENDFRPNIRLLVTKGTAGKLIKTQPQLETTLGMEIDDLIQLNRFAATDMVKDISQFLKSLSNTAEDPYTGVISPAEKQRIKVEKNEKETNNQQDIPELLSLKGTAVFNGGRLAGFLNERQTRGLLWIKGQLANEIVVLNCGGKNKGNISLRVINSQSELSPQLSDGTLEMTARIEVDADIGEITCPDFNLTTAQINRLNKQLQDLVQQEASSVLDNAKNEWQTDIFGFGQAINRKYPKEWKEIAPQWRNGLLKEMPLDLKVSANISRHGLIKDPTKAHESR